MTEPAAFRHRVAGPVPARLAGQPRCPAVIVP